MINDSESNVGTCNKRPPFVCVGCAIFLVMIFASLSLSSQAKKSATFDEIAHLTRGYVYWRYGDYRFQDNGNLPDRLAALPVLAGDHRFPAMNSLAWRKSKIGTVSQTFCLYSGNDFHSMILWGRIMIILTGCVCAVTIYIWSCRLFGNYGGLISLALFAFSPAAIANSRCITSDMTVSLMFLLAVGAFWRVLHRITPWTLLASCLAVGGLFVSKMSAFLFIPMGGVLLILCLFGGRAMEIRFGRAVMIVSRWKKMGLMVALLMCHLLVTILVIWAFFSFRYDAFHAGRGEGEQFPGGRANLLESDTAAGHTIDFCREYHLLPESYLYSLSHVLTRSGERENYFFGNISSSGSFWFFPYVYFAKMPEGTFLVLILAVLVSIMGCIRSGGFRRGLYRVAPLWCLVGVYWIFAVSADINIGHRHILPACLPVLVLAGAASGWLSRSGKVMKAVLCLSLLCTCLGSLFIWPDHISYLNFPSGGPSRARFRVVDSSLDWGQDLPALQAYLAGRERSDLPVYLTYFGTADPTLYGIRAMKLGGYGYDVSDLPEGTDRFEPGLYCISATLLQGAYFPHSKLVGELVREYPRQDLGYDADIPVELMIDQEALDLLRFYRLLNFLRQRTPDGMAGYSILVFDLKDDEINIALRG